MSVVLTLRENRSVFFYGGEAWRIQSDAAHWTQRRVMSYPMLEPEKVKKLVYLALIY